jgi:protein-S-isoprenylcysteine O-methyltransferase Ste14
MSRVHLDEATMETWKHVRAIFLLPGMAVVVIPTTILLMTGTDTLDLWHSISATRFILPVLGILFTLFGLMLMVATIRLFVTVGKGTLAPWNTTQRPWCRAFIGTFAIRMISGVMFILFGKAILAAPLSLLIWFGIFVVANVIYIPLVEELGLLKRFGEDYLMCKQNVPRWIGRNRLPARLPSRKKAVRQQVGGGGTTHSCKGQAIA